MIDRELTKQRILDELKQVEREGMDELIDALLRSDYFVAPASGQYHMNVPGGLAFHSYSVYKILTMKNKSYRLGLPEDTVRITALLHDLCKTGVRKVVNKRVRMSDGKWVDRKAYDYVDKLPLGHGEKSVIMIQKYVKLSVEEQLMIRWHMGCFEEGCDRRAFNRAMELCPAVGALHTSDCESGWFFEYIDTDLKELNGEK